MGDGVVEVDGVGEVEEGVEAHQAVVVDVAGVDGDVAGVGAEVRVGGEVVVVLAGVGVGLVGGGEVVAADGLGEEAVELRGADLAGDGGDLRVDPPGGVGGEGRGGVDGGLGDEPGAPGGDVPGVDEVPQAGEAVAQLEGLADELLGGEGGDAEDRAELGDAELGDEGAPGSGDGLFVLGGGGGEGRGVVDRRGRVEVGPPGGEGELVGGGAVLVGLALAGEGEQRGGVQVVVCDLSLGCCQRLAHVFDSSGGHRHSAMVGRPSVDSPGTWAAGSRDGRCATSSTSGFITVAHGVLDADVGHGAGPVAPRAGRTPAPRSPTHGRRWRRDRPTTSREASVPA